MPADYDFTLGKNRRLRGTGWVGLMALWSLLTLVAVVGVSIEPAGAWLLQLLNSLLGI